MGVCISTEIAPSPTLVPYDPQQVNINLTEADEEHYSPSPPRRTRRQLIPDFTVFKRIDQHAKSVPASVRSSVSTLANYLIQPCITDVEIVRTFYVWICHNISYDVQSLIGNRKPQDSETVITTGLGVCQGYSNVFTSLCRAAGIPVKMLTGYSKGIGYNPEKPITMGDKTDHAWNAVCVQNEWRFIESTWGSGHLDGTEYVREVTDLYFLMEPNLMANSHYPFMNNNETMSRKWQLLSSTLSIDQFNKDVKLHTAGLEWDLDINPRTSQLKVSRKTQLTVQAKKTPLVNIKVVLKKNGSVQTGYIFVEQVKRGIFQTTIRPPTIGKYELTFFAKVSPEENSLSNIITMALDVTDVEQNLRPYPDFSSAYGADDPLTHGLAEKIRCGGIFLGVAGQLNIPVHTQPGTRLLHKLKHSESDIADAELYAFPEEKSEVMTNFQLRLPLRGFYEFDIYTQLPDVTGNSFQLAARFLVECIQPNNLGPFPFVFGASKELDCNLVKPNVRNIQANSSVEFQVYSQKLVSAKVKADDKDFPMTGNNNTWTCTVNSLPPDKDIIIYGNNISSTLQGLYKFKSVA